MSISLPLEALDFEGITDADAQNVRATIQRGQNFQGYIPAEALGFIVRNYRELARLRALESAWLDCYVHASHFNDYGLETIEAIFDACDRERLRAPKPLRQIVEDRATLFRGCAGPVHTLGSLGPPLSTRRSGMLPIMPHTTISPIAPFTSRRSPPVKSTAAWITTTTIVSPIRAPLGAWMSQLRSSG